MNLPTDPLDTAATLREEWERLNTAAPNGWLAGFVERLLSALESAEQNTDKVAAKIGDDTWEQADALYKPQIAKLRAALNRIQREIADPDFANHSEAARLQVVKQIAAAVLTDTEPQP